MQKWNWPHSRGWTGITIDDCWKGWAILLRQKQKKLIMLPSETMIWQPEFTDKTLSRKPGAVQKESMVNRFRHFVVPFTDGYTNVLRSIITRSAHQRRWYYAGCGNNMKEHRYDVCCCSARRVFAIRESASWLMKNVRNWWIYCNRPGR
ncbi:transposase [Escherichia coli O145:H28]|nr:transposase [Escherichia coli O145:H28]GEF74673.1 transposase [Escherichia coli O145:H28]